MSPTHVRRLFPGLFRQEMGQSFGLVEIKLQVVNTSPSGIVKIKDLTQVELFTGSYENNS